mgnify:CR=1 FL=1
MIWYDINLQGLLYVYCQTASFIPTDNNDPKGMSSVQVLEIHIVLIVVLYFQ